MTRQELTRLVAERDDLKAEMDQLNSEVSYLTRTLKQIASDNVDLQSELTKAQELLANSIPLSKAEIQSGMTRVRWAELLIKQLPNGHDGRNSWLLNYAHRSAPVAKEVE